MAEALRNAALDNISISLMSLDESVHDGLRKSPGSHRRAMQAIDLCTKAGLHTTVQFILCRHNSRELPGLIEFIASHGVRALVLTYPEGDEHKRYLLMDETEIQTFRRHILPKAIEAFRSYLGYEPGEDFLALYETTAGADLSQGIYAAKAKPCLIPQEFLLVYPDGAVLPCNGIEYCHTPIVGSLRDSDLDHIWNGSKFAMFRKVGRDFCACCPMPQMFYHRIKR